MGKPKPMVFYRYESWSYWTGEYSSEERIQEDKYYLVRETPCGWWIHQDQHYNEHKKQDNRWHEGINPRWVSKTARKRFAYPTREEALEGFKARKRRQISILSHRLRRAECALKIAEGGDLSRGLSPDPIRLGMDW